MHNMQKYMNMRKLFFALVCAAAVIFTGCDNGSDPTKKGSNVMSYSDQQVEKLDNTTYKCWHLAKKEIVKAQQWEKISEGATWLTEYQLVTNARMYIKATQITEEDGAKDAYGVPYTYEIIITYWEADPKTPSECKTLDKALQDQNKGKDDKDKDDDDDEDGGKDGDTVDVSKMTENQIAKLDDKTDKCWYWCISDGTDKEEGYDWSTEQEVAQDLYDAYIMYKKEGTTVKCVYSLSDKKDPDSCEAQNED